MDAVDEGHVARVAAFLADLSEATKKHGMAVSGCCGSPHIYDLETDEQDGFYFAIYRPDEKSFDDIRGEHMAWVHKEGGRLYRHGLHAIGYGSGVLVGPEGVVDREGVPARCTGCGCALRGMRVGNLCGNCYMEGTPK